MKNSRIPTPTIAEILKEEFQPLSDARSGKEFRKLAAKNLLLKFYEETKDELSPAR